MRSDRLRGVRALLLAGCLGAQGCLLPEVDTPPLDPSLLDQQTSGTGGAACVEASSAQGFDIVPPMADLSTVGYEGQCAIVGDVTLDLAAPASFKLGSVRSIQGNLTIRGPATAQVGKVLPNLALVTGQIRFQGTDLAALPPFPKLTETNGVIVHDNANLLKVDGFNALPSTIQIEIERNPSLTTIGGFSALKTYSSNIRIRDNFNLAQLTAFASLEETSGGFHLQAGKIEKLTLPKLSQGGTIIVNDTSLLQIQLPALISVSQIRLRKLNLLTTIGVPKLQTIASLYLEYLDKITDAAWLPKTAKLIGTANVCPNPGPLIIAVTDWAATNGSTGAVEGKLCQG